MPASQLPGRLADRFLADSPFATGYRLQATGFAPGNAAIDTTNAGTNTGKTPFARANAALIIATDLPGIQSSSRSYPRMQHSTPRVMHSCSRRNCPVLNHVAKGLLLSSLSTPATAAESNGSKLSRLEKTAGERTGLRPLNPRGAPLKPADGLSGWKTTAAAATGSAAHARPRRPPASAPAGGRHPSSGRSS